MIGEKNKISPTSNTRFKNKFDLKVKWCVDAKPIIPAISLICCEQVNEF